MVAEVIKTKTVTLEVQVPEVLVIVQTANKTVVQVLNPVNQANQVTTDLVTQVVMVHMMVTPTMEHKVAQVVVLEVAALSQVKEQTLLPVV